MKSGLSVSFKAHDVKIVYRSRTVWYKPWTWFKEEPVLVIGSPLEFIECSAVSEPVNPACKIKEK